MHTGNPKSISDTVEVDIQGLATEDRVGLVKGSDEVRINDDGSLSIVAITFDKLVSGEGIIIMDGGGASL